ncbi:Uncharacterized protein Fot_04485 [Forsythia ovata]|uniref:Uncharacterized protein n=1 Tax=Forsythia ovata TaxID=205694 RepID=A0ABD1XDB0_9LAMI
MGADERSTILSGLGRAEGDLASLTGTRSRVGWPLTVVIPSATPPFFSLSSCCDTTLLAHELCQSYRVPPTCLAPETLRKLGSKFLETLFVSGGGGDNAGFVN